MVVIRLARGGAKKRPFFNIIATDSRNRRDGRFIERVGFYNPVAPEGTPGRLTVNAERLAYWEGVGAQLSPTVARLVKTQKAA
ncbi:30S ribosomal protein S16 [Methyloversatilis universalis]|uniref:30S ribosomal protein S16 n=1 Tax=Methyloversatilis universalis TaxID=378211 RepID=UPI00037CEC71|nr:30S ribosomal protein S16 [Methyloversatilis universalis]